MKAAARVQCRRPEAKTTEVEARMATYLWFVQLRTTDLQQQAVHNCVNCGWKLRHLSKGHAQMALLYTGDSAHDLSVKLSP